MRIRQGLAVALLLALTVTGCGTDNNGNKVATGGGNGKGSTAGSGKLTDKEAVLAFAKCMRQNGIPNFADPEIGADGGYELKMPKDVPQATVDKAFDACKEYLPNGGAPPKVDPEDIKKMRKFAKCMRENGVENYPDPDDNGGLKAPPTGDPQLEAAEKKCAQYGPDDDGRGDG
ncbi:MAG: hypothetical protein ACRDT6_23375 [Micromonosporaceae bacterium]